MSGKNLSPCSLQVWLSRRQHLCSKLTATALVVLCVVLHCCVCAAAAFPTVVLCCTPGFPCRRLPQLHSLCRAVCALLFFPTVVPVAPPASPASAYCCCTLTVVLCVLCCSSPLLCLLRLRLPLQAPTAAALCLLQLHCGYSLQFSKTLITKLSIFPH